MKRKITKKTMEKMCRQANMKPVHRGSIDGYEVFVADGYSSIPAITYRKFDVHPGEFKDGAFCTLWYLTRGEDTLLAGCPLLFKTLHDLHLGDGRQRARINSALAEAKDFIECAKRAAARGGVLDG